MKLTAYIVLVSLVLLGINNFMHHMEPETEAMELSCDMDCCGAQDDCDKEKESGTDHTCPPGCDCDCCFHITALYYQFMRIPASEVHAYHYAGYSNNYKFEYLIPHFQPPRLA